MTGREIKQANLEADLADLVNKYSWPHGQKIVKELLRTYSVERRVSPKPSPKAIEEKS